MQKSACKIILKNSYISYKQALLDLDLEDLSERRNQLCKVFAQKSATNQSLDFKLNNKLHFMQLRKPELFEVSHCRTERYKKSAMPHMERLLNQT